MTVEGSRGVIFIVFMDFFNSFLCSDVIIVRESKSAGRQFIFEVPDCGGQCGTALCCRMKR